MRTRSLSAEETDLRLADAPRPLCALRGVEGCSAILKEFVNEHRAEADKKPGEPAAQASWN